ncbi:Uncharacterised protein [Xylophilus ampelinus]|nr:hypothetical protein [Variovorax sp.]VTY39882.1 Uncharacterised protein [Xylophilus ampelinus]
MSRDHTSFLHVVLTLLGPPPGVVFAVQRGRDELVPPFMAADQAVSFAITVTLGPPLADGAINFGGPFAQGRPSERFVYLNSGTYAGQVGTPWARRAKISLVGIPRALVEGASGDAQAAVQAQIVGAMKDGGPVCASVRAPQIAWRRVIAADHRSWNLDADG